MEHTENSDVRRAIPAVDRLLADPDVAKLIALYGRDRVRVQARREIEELRAWLAAGPASPVPAASPASAASPAPPIPSAVEEALAALPRRIGEGLAAAFGPPLRRVLNATGIFLHTNLGRAPLPRAVAAALPDLLTAYCDLEIDLATGKRGQRNARVDRLLQLATGGEAAVVVNNNAAALVLALATLAQDREVVVSRGELVEIGGSFRIPEIMAAAGARLVEVGATNRTRLADYRAAVTPETALLLKVFPSNFRLTGFVAAVEPAELAALGREVSVPVLVDEGSGLLAPHPAPQLAGHPSLSQLIAAGCDLACGSGDKLLGGPQAGLLVGRKELIERCRRHPFYRALRPDRAGLATLEGVLRLHLAGAPLPLDRLWEDPATQRQRLARVAAEIGSAPEIVAPEIVAAEAFLGGGSAPEAPIPGLALALPGAPELLARLRLGEPPVVGYLREGQLLLDLRTVDPEDDPALVTAVRAALAAPATA
jgi:L-seryl-tRNA(Ser) seleniumtransferase